MVIRLHRVGDLYEKLGHEANPAGAQPRVDAERAGELAVVDEGHRLGVAHWIGDEGLGVRSRFEPAREQDDLGTVESTDVHMRRVAECNPGRRGEYDVAAPVDHEGLGAQQRDLSTRREVARRRNDRVLQAPAEHARRYDLLAVHANLGTAFHAGHNALVFPSLVGEDEGFSGPSAVMTIDTNINIGNVTWLFDQSPFLPPGWETPTLYFVSPNAPGYVNGGATDGTLPGPSPWNSAAPNGEMVVGPVPEPGALALFGAGLLVAGASLRRTRREN